MTTHDIEQTNKSLDFPAVMTVDQIAEYLQIGRRTIYNLAGAGQIPTFKIAGNWRFFRPEVDKWLAELSRGNMTHGGDNAEEL